MLRYSLLIFIILIVKAALYSQTASITNIQVSQQTDNSGLVDVYFDLSGPGGSYYLNMSVSFYGGSTFTSIGSTFLSGDIGPISPGTNKHIIWDGGQSFPDTYSMQSQLKIIALKSDCGSTLVDSRDGQTYSTVQIGAQCWMAENLNYQTTSSWWYNNISYYGEIYGRLYLWEAALTSCPDGWHLPSDEEWKQMEMALGISQSEADDTGWRGTYEGENMKSNSGWMYNGNGTNSSGFNAFPGGLRKSVGSFINQGDTGIWWSSTEYSGSKAWCRALFYDYYRVERNTYYNTYGFSVRCLKN